LFADFRYGREHDDRFFEILVCIRTNCLNQASIDFNQCWSDTREVYYLLYMCADKEAIRSLCLGCVCLQAVLVQTWFLNVARHAYWYLRAKRVARQAQFVAVL
jgi:hypothetical protein